MADDPGFIFYPGDYLRDTQCLSEPAQTAYDRIMCEHMRNICISKQQLKFFTKRLNPEQNDELLHVLTETPAGFQIKWVADSIIKRREYSESRRKNRSSTKKDMSNTSKTYVEHMDNEDEIVIEDEIKNENKIGDARGKIEALLFAGIGDLYLDGQRPKWQHINFDFEVNSFKEKVRGSPEDYLNHDTNGIRKAFQYQLRYAKTIQQNGSGKGNNKKGDADRATAQAVIEAYSDVFRTGSNGQGSGPAS